MGLIVAITLVFVMATIAIWGIEETDCNLKANCLLLVSAVLCELSLLHEVMQKWQLFG